MKNAAFRGTEDVFFGRRPSRHVVDDVHASNNVSGRKNHGTHHSIMNGSCNKTFLKRIFFEGSEDVFFGRRPARHVVDACTYPTTCLDGSTQLWSA